MPAAIKGTELISSLGKDEFLKLLITKMRHQDPLNPRADEEFLAQLAQFTAMEQMINLNNNVENFIKAFGDAREREAQSAALNLLGTHVKAWDPDDKEKKKVLEGMVTKITSKDGVPRVVLTTDNKEREVGMEDIFEVRLY